MAGVHEQNQYYAGYDVPWHLRRRIHSALEGKRDVRRVSPQVQHAAGELAQQADGLVPPPSAVGMEDLPAEAPPVLAHARAVAAAVVRHAEKDWGKAVMQGHASRVEAEHMRLVNVFIGADGLDPDRWRQLPHKLELLAEQVVRRADARDRQSLVLQHLDPSAVQASAKATFQRRIHSAQSAPPSTRRSDSGISRTSKSGSLHQESSTTLRRLDNLMGKWMDAKNAHAHDKGGHRHGDAAARSLSQGEEASEVTVAASFSAKRAVAQKAAAVMMRQRQHGAKQAPTTQAAATLAIAREQSTRSPSPDNSRSTKERVLAARLSGNLSFSRRSSTNKMKGPRYDQMSPSVQAYWRACSAAGAHIDPKLVDALEASHMPPCVLKVPDLALTDTATSMLAQALQQQGGHLTGLHLVRTVLSPTALGVLLPVAWQLRLSTVELFHSDVPRSAWPLLVSAMGRPSVTWSQPPSTWWCTLRSLNLTGNNLGDQGLAAVTEALCGMSCLESLSLRQTGVTDWGAANLAALVARLPSLSALDVSFNQLGGRACAALGTVLPQCTGLTRLEVGWNTLSDGLQAMLWPLLQEQRGSSASSSSCGPASDSSPVAPAASAPCSDGTAAAADRGVPQPGSGDAGRGGGSGTRTAPSPSPLARPPRTPPGLRHLDLSASNLTGKDLLALAAMLKSRACPALEHVNLSYNFLAGVAGQCLLRHIHDAMPQEPAPVVSTTLVSATAAVAALLSPRRALASAVAKATGAAGGGGGGGVAFANPAAGPGAASGSGQQQQQQRGSPYQARRNAVMAPDPRAPGTAAAPEARASHTHASARSGEAHGATVSSTPQHGQRGQVFVITLGCMVPDYDFVSEEEEGQAGEEQPSPRHDPNTSRRCVGGHQLSGPAGAAESFKLDLSQAVPGRAVAQLLMEHEAHARQAQRTTLLGVKLNGVTYRRDGDEFRSMDPLYGGWLGGAAGLPRQGTLELAVTPLQPSLCPWLSNPRLHFNAARHSAAR